MTLGIGPHSSVLLLLLLNQHLLFNDRLEQRDLGNYKTGLHQIFRAGRHVRVDVQYGSGFAIGQATNFRRKIGRNRRHGFILGTRIRQ